MNGPFLKALEFTLRWEGGYVDDPDDHGGATNKGITEHVYHAWRGGKGLEKRAVREIEDVEVQKIYFEQYWVLGRCYQLPHNLNMAHFDGCVNHGVGQSARFVQRAVGVNADGSIGPITMKAIQAMRVEDILKAYLLQRKALYEHLANTRPGNDKFLAGWMNRLNSLAAHVGVIL